MTAGWRVLFGLLIATGIWLAVTGAGTGGTEIAHFHGMDGSGDVVAVDERFFRSGKGTALLVVGWCFGLAGAAGLLSTFRRRAPEAQGAPGPD